MRGFLGAAECADPHALPGGLDLGREHAILSCRDATEAHRAKMVATPRWHGIEEAGP
jgi:hypothetical protein